MYKDGSVTQRGHNGRKERFSLVSDYDSSVEGRKRLAITRINHEVGLTLEIEEYSPGAKGGKRAYTKLITAQISRDVLMKLIDHLKGGLER